MLVLLFLSKAQEVGGESIETTSSINGKNARTTVIRSEVTDLQQG